MTKKDLQMLVELFGWNNKLSELERKIDKHEIILDSDMETDSVMETRVKALERSQQRAAIYTKIGVSVVTLLISALTTLIVSGKFGPFLQYLMGA